MSRFGEFGLPRARRTFHTFAGKPSGHIDADACVRVELRSKFFGIRPVSSKTERSVRFYAHKETLSAFLSERTSCTKFRRQNNYIRECTFDIDSEHTRTHTLVQRNRAQRASNGLQSNRPGNAID